MSLDACFCARWDDELERFGRTVDPGAALAARARLMSAYQLTHAGTMLLALELRGVSTVGIRREGADLLAGMLREACGLVVDGLVSARIHSMVLAVMLVLRERLPATGPL